MTIGYNYQIIQPNYQANLQNTELIAQVMMAKQGQYNQAYAGLERLKKDALNIRFINQKEQSKIDSFNEKINKMFEGGNFGDLSDSRNAQNYYSVFDEIGRDTRLIGRYKQDQSYQDAIRTAEGKRRAKDPAKAGFGNINYQNFMDRVNEYANLDLDSADAEGFVLRPYVDYVDIDKEIANLSKSIVPEKFTKSRVENGYIVTETYMGRDPEKVKAAVSEFMQTRGLSQVREEAEYTFRRAKGDPNFQQIIYNDHVGYNIRQQEAINSRLDDINKELKGTKDPNVIRTLASQKARLESELTETQLTLKSPTDYFNRDENEIINDLSKVTGLDKTKNYSAAYGGYSVSRKVEPDRTFLELQKMGMRVTEFNKDMKFKYDKLAQDRELALIKEENDKEGKSSSNSSSAGGSMVEAIEEGISYVSENEGTHIDYASVHEKAQASLSKLYANQTNFLKDGLTNGNNRLSGENIGLELLINSKSLDNNEYYKDSPYLRAWKVARDEVYKTHSEYADLMDRRPTDNAGWNELKKLNRIVTDRVNQMMTYPKTREEAQFLNHLQDIQANKTSLEDFMAEANANGNPVEYIKNNPQIKILGAAVYDFNLPPNASKAQKEKLASNLNNFRGSFDNFLNTPYSVYSSENIKINEGEYNAKYIDPNRVRDIPLAEVSKIKTSDDGTVKVYFKPEAFQEYFIKDEQDDKVTDVKKSGALANNSKYFTVKGQGEYKVVTAADIKSKGYLEYKDPTFNKLNWSNQLGLGVSAKPQTRYDVTADNQPVQFDVRKSTITGTIELSILGGPFVDTKTSNAQQVIDKARELISKRTLEELQNQ